MKPLSSQRSNYLTLSAEAVYTSLESSPRGLSAATAASRLASSGPNELPTARRPPIIGKVLAQFTNLFAIVLLAASVITFGSYLVQSPRDVGNLELAIAILGVVLLNAAIGFFQEYSAEKTAEALEALVPHSARVRRDGETVEVPARELVRGDVFVLEAGDDVCCDGRLVEANGLTVDDVALTGESAPVHRTADAAPSGTATMEAANLVFMGTSVVEGTATAVAFATGADTEFGRIYQMTAQVSDVASPLQRKVNRMAKQVSVVAIALAAVVFALRAGHHECPSGRQLRVRPRGHGRAGTRRPPRHPLGLAGYRGATHGHPPRPDQTPRRGGNPRVDHRHLHRQDRNPHRSPDDRHRRMGIRPPPYRHRGRLQPERRRQRTRPGRRPAARRRPMLRRPAPRARPDQPARLENPRRHHRRRHRRRRDQSRHRRRGRQP